MNWFAKTAKRTALAIADRLDPRRIELRKEMLAAVRAWSGANDNRLTKNHWGAAGASSVNHDLLTDLNTLRNRIRYERQNNGWLAGMVNSYVLDVVGPAGPALHLVSANKGWVVMAEKIWRDWFDLPDVNRQLTGAEVLAQDEVMQWDCGESLSQLVSDPTVSGAVKTRLLTIHPRRLQTPFGQSAQRTVTLGVKRDERGRPQIYYVREDTDNELGFLVGTNYVELSADNVVHDFDAS